MSNDVVQPLPVARPLTARAKRRSWMELPLRVWFVLLILVGFATAVYVVTGLSEILSERNLIEHGIKTTATVKEIFRNATIARNVRETDNLIDLVLVYKLPGSEKEISSKGPLAPVKMPSDGSPAPMISINKQIEIRVDPDEPTRWTNRTGHPEFGPRLAILPGLVPILAVLAVVILLRRRTILNVWRNGAAAEAVVIDAKQSALAPQSRLIRFTVDGSPDRRIRTALRPTHAGVPVNGDRLPILFAANGRGPAVFADLYNS